MAWDYDATRLCPVCKRDVKCHIRIERRIVRMQCTVCESTQEYPRC